MLLKTAHGQDKLLSGKRNQMVDTVKVTVLLSEDEFARLDSYCKSRGYKKSGLIARLVREHMDREGFQVQLALPIPVPYPRERGLGE